MKKLLYSSLSLVLFFTGVNQLNASWFDPYTSSEKMKIAQKEMETILNLSGQTSDKRNKAKNKLAANIREIYSCSGSKNQIEECIKEKIKATIYNLFEEEVSNILDTFLAKMDGQQFINKIALKQVLVNHYRNYAITRLTTGENLGEAYANMENWVKNQLTVAFYIPQN